jgi:hypothetical protein
MKGLKYVPFPFSVLIFYESLLNAIINIDKQASPGSILAPFTRSQFHESYLSIILRQYSFKVANAGSQVFVRLSLNLIQENNGS